ncbi:anti-sigma-E factor RseA [Xenorhabdus innexi]|uniref:Anti-sigma factor MucA n=1 Tax=Xenorhabdus innexi TaxID=290109 RepID=A0A1N6MVD0_9GAMM|nr:anti-sigma-E factor RseA [Xenorhabdus innexi]PHM38243.1 anti-sigma factor MucA [Xenorhabdus innexi]SIP72780.1 Sigma-E factor negative regulatory protein [Xenorhabdus innexi]
MQREKLSALMDGEALDSEIVRLISEDAEMQKQWERYHLIRDTLRGDVSGVLHLDIASQVAQALEKEPVHINPAVVPESQPKPDTWQNLPFWHKLRPLTALRPWASQMTQVGVAACVSLAVIIGVQQYNGSDTDTQLDNPVFNTLPVMGSASPVGLSVPAEHDAFGGDLSMQVRESNKRIDAMLQQYELFRRINAERELGLPEVNAIHSGEQRPASLNK